MRAAFFYSLSHDLTPTLQAIGAVMFGAWTLAYVQILRAGFKEKTYGVPLACIFLNISWEFIFSFNLVTTSEATVLVWGNRLWFLADCIIVTQAFLYGRRWQTNPWVREHFHTICVAGLSASLIGRLQLRDIFQRHLRPGPVLPDQFRPQLAVHSAAVFTASPQGLPARRRVEQDGRKRCRRGVLLHLVADAVQRGWHAASCTSHRTAPEFASALFLYVSIAMLDFTYIYLYRQRRRAPRAAPATGAYQPIVA